MTARRWPQPIPRAQIKSREKARQRLADAYTTMGHPRGLPIIDASKLLKRGAGK